MRAKRLSRLERETVNKVVRVLAGHGPYAQLEHIGRKSGIRRTTPVRGYARGQVIYVGINHGPRADWLRNIQAAGRCRVRFRGRWYDCSAPRVVPFGDAAAAIPQPDRAVMTRVLGTTSALALPVAGPVPQGRPWRWIPLGALAVGAGLRRTAGAGRQSQSLRRKVT